MYRQNVVGVFRNNENLFLVGKRTHSDGIVWQFPQGGIDPTEKPQEAIKREMWEELGVKKFNILKQTNEEITYLFPPEAKLPADKKKYIGQSQTWFLLELDSEHQPNLAIAPDQEFCELKWVTLQEVMQNVVHWKREAYLKGLQLLGLEL